MSTQATTQTRPNRLGIEMLTLMGMNPVEHLRLAGELGCVGISSGLTCLPMPMIGVHDYAPYPAWDLRGDAALRRETRAAMADTGVHIALGEGFSARAGQEVSAFAADLDLMAELGAARINAIGLEPDAGRCRDQLAELAGMVWARDMEFSVEFVPGYAVSSLGTALEVVRHAGEKAGVLLDAMHFFRSGGTLEQLAAVEPARLGYVQLCDAPRVSPFADYTEEVMFNRRIPGEGEMPLAELIALLPCDVPVSVEVPNLAALKADGPRAHAARAVAGARALGA